MTKRFALPGLVHMLQDRDLPDAGEGMCCMGAAVYGPGGCTCWRPVHDLEQQQPQTDLAPCTREAMCGDCAFRPDSPERNGADRAAYDADDLEALVAGTEQFWCHQGIRLVTAQQHPTGAVHPVPGQLAYDPPIIEGVPYKADGTPAERCAGLAARRRSQAKAAGR